jgi:predicted transcriptional regulator
MEVLWQQRAATAEQVREALPDALHDSSVRTLLRVLEAKGYVQHSLQGRAYVYHPSVGRSKVQRSALHNMLKRLFGGSASALVLRLIEDEQLSAEQLEELKQAFDRPSSGPRKGE